MTVVVRPTPQRSTARDGGAAADPPRRSRLPHQRAHRARLRLRLALVLGRTARSTGGFRSASRAGLGRERQAPVVYAHGGEMLRVGDELTILRVQPGGGCIAVDHGRRAWRGDALHHARSVDPIDEIEAPAADRGLPRAVGVPVTPDIGRRERALSGSDVGGEWEGGRAAARGKRVRDLHVGHAVARVAPAARRAAATVHAGRDPATRSARAPAAATTRSTSAARRAVARRKAPVLSPRGRRGSSRTTDGQQNERHCSPSAKRHAGFYFLRSKRARTRRLASARGGPSARRRGTHRGVLRPPQPKPADSHAQIVAAIRAALDEGRYERAGALLDLLRQGDNAAVRQLVRDSP
jgi:hypothetical protein